MCAKNISAQALRLETVLILLAEMINNHIRFIHSHYCIKKQPGSVVVNPGEDLKHHTVGRRWEIPLLLISNIIRLHEPGKVWSFFKHSHKREKWKGVNCQGILPECDCLTHTHTLPLTRSKKNKTCALSYTKAWVHFSLSISSDKALRQTSLKPSASHKNKWWQRVGVSPLALANWISYEGQMCWKIRSGEFGRK